MKKRILIAIAIGLAAIFVVALVNRDRTNPAIEREREAIRALGYPATWDELHAHLTPEGDPENAAPVYAEAFKVYDESMVDSSLVAMRGWEPDLAPGESMPEKVYLETGFLVESNARCFELLREAAGIPFCKSPYSSPDIASMDLFLDRSYASIGARVIARLLLSKTAYDLKNGDVAAALENVHSGLALSRLLYSDPTFLGALGGTALDSLALDSIGLLLGYSDISSVELEKLYGYLEGSADITNNLLGQIYADLDPDMVIRWAHRPGGVPGFAPNILDRLLGNNDAAYLRSLRYIQVYLENANQPRSVLRDHPALTGLHKEALIPTPYRTMSSLSTDGLVGMVDVRAVRQARLRLARAAIRIKIHYLETGEFPETLEELELDSTLDPMTGGSLIYGHDDERAWVYSVWANGEDDGGLDFVNQEYLGDDIALVVWR